MAVADVSYFLGTCLLKNVTPQSGLIIIGHLLEAEVVVRLILLVRRVVVLDDDVVATKVVAARVIHPNIVAGVHETQANRVFAICQPREEAIAQTVLEDHDRPLAATVAAVAGVGVFLAWNTVDSVDVVVCRRVEVLFKWIAELFGHKAGRRSVAHLVLD